MTEPMENPVRALRRLMEATGLPVDEASFEAAARDCERPVPAPVPPIRDQVFLCLMAGIVLAAVALLVLLVLA